MGVFTNSAKNTMLNALTNLHLSLHTANPGATGASEVTGGGYARQPATFSAAASGARNLSADRPFSVPAGATVAFVGYWDALTGGNFLGSHDVTDEPFGTAGTYTVTAAGTSLSILD